MERPTKEEIRTLPLYVGLDLGKIHIVETDLDAKKALEELKGETHLGFDTESKPIFLKGEVSPGPMLIQLATEFKAYLFPTRFPFAVSAAAAVLNNPAIQKVGFGLKDDNRELRGKLNIDIVNTKDLSIVLKHLAGEKNSIGARAAVAMMLKARLGKGAQKSNWGAYPLKDNQILYAANDAHAAISIERILHKMNKFYHLT
ncbi:3'-5' exonuclease domain-containing protein 2 [Marinomonas sp. 15G1-11]|uniref:3'-5' exonuclease domain-containing protein 2 n=1 Tax=Marinomonas phaeophyticola TaxID=3004091 RepID=A0ABT4JT89_9GAMM|nr:3'-5' exonuclease [Marinomonas sp. 15G1-11]MCZ2721582.1 3'-5' exonuclease domain-containing protein 2 [Marinomonas sp. 15G1-11]